MVKKIFKITGIVTASVLAFVGVVFGILAAMGKFKTPIVFPSQLQFVESEQTVILTGKENGSAGREYKSFILTGISNSEHAVNQRVCFITFDKGVELIELLDSEFNVITPIQNRYRVLCNEPIYYRLKDSAKNMSKTDGKVVMRARDEKNMVVSNYLTLWLDRPVEEIYLDNNPTETYSNHTQQITLGIDIRQDMSFMSSPTVALDPISRENGKIVELYYDDPANPNDLVFIDNTKTADKVDGYDFLKLDGRGQLYFESDKAGIFKFRLAVFDTYQSRVDYLLTEDSNTDTNLERIQNMVTTALEINVVNSNVESVGMLSSGVALNLYSDNNYITLNADRTDDVNNNNLSLFMTRNGQNSDLRFNEVAFTLDETRYPSVWTAQGVQFESEDGKKLTFNKIADNSLGKVRFTGFGDEIDGVDYGYSVNTQSGQVVLSLNIQSRFINITLNLGKINLNNKTNIVSMTYNDNESEIEFTCSNGLAFYENINSDTGLNTCNIKLLRTGSYLEFYKYDSVNSTFRYADDFKYELSNPTGSGRNKSWNIIVKSEPNLLENESLVLGIIVVNNNGGKLLFDTVDVRVSEITFNFDLLNRGEHTLNVNYSEVENKYITIYGELSVADIVKINAGSYNAVVFVTEYKEDHKYDVDVLENVTYTLGSADNAKRYVLVGYTTNSDGTIHFINKVRARAGATNKNTQIYMLQLQNGYNQSAEEMLDVILKDYSDTANITLENIVRRNYISGLNMIQIHISYDMVASEVVLGFDTTDQYVSVNNGKVSVVENSSNVHRIYISSPRIAGMIENIFNVTNAEDLINYNLTFNQYNSKGELQTNRPSNIYIKGDIYYDIVDNHNRLVVPYEVTNALSDEKSYYIFTFTYAGQTVQSMPIYITSTAPTNIALNIDSAIIELPNSETKAREQDAPYIKVVVSYDAESYIYTTKFYRNSSDNNPLSISDVGKFFNASSTGENLGRFIVYPSINGITQNINYTSRDTDIFNTNRGGYNVGSTILDISSGAIHRFLRVDVVPATDISDNSLFNITTPHGVTEVDDETYSLAGDDNVRYTFDGQEISKQATNLEVSNIHNIQFGGQGNIEVKPTTLENVKGFELTVGDTVVLTAVVSNGDWVFTRKSYFYTSLQLSFDISSRVITTPKTITIKFSSSIEVNKNTAWENSSVYVGTKVLLLESTNEEYTTQSLFRVKNALSGGATVIVAVTNATKDAHNENTYVFNTVGTSTITFTYSDTEIARFNIEVLPNIKVIENEDIKVMSATKNNSINTLFTLKQYDNSIVYGTNNDNMYSNASKLTAVSDDIYNNIAITSNVENSLFNFTNGNLEYSVGWLTSIDKEYVETLTIKNNNYILKTIDVTLTNQYGKIETTYDSSIYNDNSFNLMSHTEIQSFIKNNDSTYNSLKDIEITYFDTNSSQDITLNSSESINLNDGFFTILKNVPEKTIVKSMIFTFYDGVDETKLLTYTLDKVEYRVNILPYVPSAKAEVNALSGSDFDLINDIFANLASNANISSVIIKDYSEQFTNTEIKGSGYSSNNNELIVRLNEIVGNEKKVNITFTITYKDGISSEFIYELTIINRQTLTLDYPFNDLKIDADKTSYTFVFTNDFDGNNLGRYVVGGSTSSDPNPRYVLEGVHNYEPVLIGNTINFNYDEYSALSRVGIENLVNSENDFTISLIGYQSKNDVINYVKSNSYIIDNANKTVKFNSNPIFTSNSYAYFIFKITTASGNYGYYFVHLYNQGNGQFVNVDRTNTVEAYIEDQVANNTSLLDIINRVYGSDAKAYIANEFKLLDANLDNIDYYLLDIADLKNTENLLDYLKNTIDDGTFDESTKYTIGDKVNDATLTTLYNYTTIRLGLVYRGIQTEYIGNMVLVLRPKYTEKSDNLAITNNGVYYINLDANTTEYSNPFTIEGGTFKSANLHINDAYNEVIKIDEDIVDKLKINQYVTNEDLEFSVDYIYEVEGHDFVIRINFTLERLAINTSPATFNVGEFDTTNKLFNNRLKLSELIGNYNKSITINDVRIDLATINSDIDIVSKSVKLVIIDNIKYLEFTQTTSRREQHLKIEFTEITGQSLTREVDIIVASGIYIAHGTGTEGFNRDTALIAEKFNSDIFYQQENGSFVTFKNEKSELTQVTSYTLGGLTIYTNTDSTLDIGFDERDFVTSADENGIEEITNTNKNVNFTHSPLEVIIEFTIKIKTNSGYYQIEASNVLVDLAHKFYVKIAKTYEGIVPVYKVNGADHESIISNKYNLTALMFEDIFEENDTTNKNLTYLDNNENKNIYNSRRVALVTIDRDENGNILSTNYVYDYDALKIGFTNINNPNYIKFTSDGAHVTDGIDTESKTIQNITFDEITSGSTNNRVVVHMNIAGVDNISTIYNYNVLPSDSKLDNVDFVLDTASKEKNYIALTIKDENSSNDSWKLDESGIGVKIASIQDKDNSVLYISDAKINVTGGETDTTLLVTKVIDDENEIVTYSLVSEHYTIILTRDQDRAIYVNLFRHDTSRLFDMLKLTLTMYGDTDKVFDNVEIVFFNVTIESRYATSYDQAWATHAINMTSANADTRKIYISPNSDNLDNDFGSDISLNLKNTKYRIGSRQEVITESKNNDLIEFTRQDNNNLLSTKAVGEDAYATLNFEVSYDKYIIGKIDYMLHLRPNLKVKVKGKDLPSGNLRFETQYQLDERLLTNDMFPHVDDLHDDKADLENLFVGLFSNDGSERELDFNSMRFKLVPGGQFDVVDENGENIYLNAKKFDDEKNYYELENGKLTLKQDIKGVLELVIQVDLGANGLFEVYWDINITGFVNVKYNTLGENSIITMSGEGFMTGREVDLLNNISTDTSGILVETGLNYKYLDDTSSEAPISVAVNYQIVEYTPSINASELFTDKDKGIPYTPSSVEGKQIRAILPPVPQSDKNNIEYYLAVYKITLNYYNTTRTLYVSYKLYDTTRVQANLNNASVNVDNSSSLIPFDNGVLGLKLFHFTEVYNKVEDAENKNDLPARFTITLIKDGGINKYKLTLFDQEETNTYNEVDSILSSSPTEFIDEVNGIKYMIEIQDGYRISYYTTADLGETWKSEYSNKYTLAIESGSEDVGTGMTNHHTLFISAYNNIEEFKTFIDNITGIDLSNVAGHVSGVERLEKYALIDLGNGTWGIDLKEKLEDDKLFNNELIANLEIKSNDVTIVSISRYSESSGKGFKLTTDNKVIPNTLNIRLNDIFIDRDLISIPDEYKTVNIVGISDLNNIASSDWFKATGGVADNYKAIGSIDIPMGITTGGMSVNTYTLYEFTYSVGGNGIYNLQDTFYFISSSSSSIVVVDYSSSVQSYFFLVRNGASLDMTNKVKVYTMENNIVTPNSISGDIILVDTDYSEYLIISGNKISANSDKLQEYKNANPTANYLSVIFRIETSKSVQFRVDFELPKQT